MSSPDEAVVVVVTQRGTITARLLSDDPVGVVPFDAGMLTEAMRRAVAQLPPQSEPGPTKVNFGHWQRLDHTAVWFAEVSMDFISHDRGADLAVAGSTARR